MQKMREDTPVTGVCGRCMEHLLHDFLGMQVTADNMVGKTFQGTLVGFKVDGPLLKLVLDCGKVFVVVDRVLRFRVFDGSRIVFEASSTITREVKRHG
jgi:hypothetical protein